MMTEITKIAIPPSAYQSITQGMVPSIAAARVRVCCWSAPVAAPGGKVELSSYRPGPCSRRVGSDFDPVLTLDRERFPTEPRRFIYRSQPKRT